MQQSAHKVSTIQAPAPGVHVSALESAFLRELAGRSEGRRTAPFVPYGSQALLAAQVQSKGLVALQYTGTGARVLLTPKGTALLQYLETAQGVA